MLDELPEEELVLLELDVELPEDDDELVLVADPPPAGVSTSARVITFMLSSLIYPPAPASPPEATIETNSPSMYLLLPA